MERRCVGQGGFSTIEIVATVLLVSAGLIPLFDAMTNIQRNAHLIARSEMRNTSLTDAVEYMKSVNVGVIPDGEISFDAWSLSWSAEPLPTPKPDDDDEETRDRNRVTGSMRADLSILLPAANVSRKITLYKVTAKITVPSSSDSDTLKETAILHMIGWEDIGR